MFIFKEFALRWILGVVIHLILLLCAFELRRKPEEKILAGLRGNKSANTTGPAKRVVLTIVDGLRWDLFSMEASKNNLYNKLISSNGTVGICYSFADDYLSGLKIMMSGVPHVNLKSDVESLFSHTKVLYVGSPSVDLLFPGDWEKHFYKGEWENTTKYPFPRLLSEWVINKVEGLLTNRSDINCENGMHENQLVIIYLPSIGMSNHLYGPKSSYTAKELLYTMDSLYWLYRNLCYNDSRTAFILTSSNSFAVPQSHEALNYSVKAAPFVTWGAGFRAAKGVTKEKYIPNRRRGQMSIEDIAPLIASLLGVPIPVNSLGISPLYSLKNNELRAKVSLNNAKQIAYLFGQFESRLSFGWSRYFSPLKPSVVRQYVINAEDFLKSNDYNKSIASSQQVIQLCFDGIVHYSEFNVRNTAACVLLSLLGWTLVTFGWVMKKVKITPLIQRELLPRPDSQSVITGPKPKQSCFKLLLTPRFIVNLIGAAFFLGSLWVLIYMSVPLSILSCMLLTVLMVWLIFKEIFVWTELYSTNTHEPYQGSAGKPLIHFLFFMLLTLIVEYPTLLSFSVITGISFSCLTDLRRKQKPYPTLWTMSSLPLLVILHYGAGAINLPFLLFGSLLWIIVYGILVYCLKPVCFDFILLLSGSLPMISAILKTLHGVPSSLTEVIITWSPGVLIFLIPLIGSSRLSVRLLQICSCLCIPVTFLSMGLELTAIFFILVHIFSWILIEGFPDFDKFLFSSTKYELSEGNIVWSDIRCCIYYFSYVIISFLAIGNSFDVQTWLNSWPSFLSPRAMEFELFKVFLRTFPVIILINVALNVIGRRNLSGYLVTKQFLASLVSFSQFLLKAEDSTAISLQFIFLLSYLAEPVSVALLVPSLFSKFNKVESSMIVSVNNEKNKSNVNVTE